MVPSRLDIVDIGVSIGYSVLVALSAKLRSLISGKIFLLGQPLLEYTRLILASFLVQRILSKTDFVRRVS